MLRDCEHQDRRALGGFYRSQAEKTAPDGLLKAPRGSGIPCAFLCIRSSFSPVVIFTSIVEYMHCRDQFWLLRSAIGDEGLIEAAICSFLEASLSILAGENR